MEVPALQLRAEAPARRVGDMPGTRLNRIRGKVAAAVSAALLAGALASCTEDPFPPDERQTAGPYAALEAFSAGMLDEGAPAVLIEVRRHGEVWVHAAGVRNLDGHDPVRISDGFGVGSITMSMVAVSVMKLVEEGRVSLDNPVSTYLPEFGTVLQPPGPVTVRQLLKHKSGLPDFTGPLLASGAWQDVANRPLPLEQQLALAAKVPWEGKLAQGFDYSRSNYAALGLMVQRLRGRSLRAVLKADSADPLGLTSTGLQQAGTTPATQVHGYVTLNQQRLDATGPAWLSELASGGAVSTVSELNAFYAGLLQGKLLRGASLAAMLQRDSDIYGLGVWTWNDTCTNRLYYGHPGDIDGYGTISLTSEDGSRQLTLAMAYPPEPPTLGFSPWIFELERVAQDALNSLC